jgi:uncharacterized Zn finger protein (UPF0148 family)
MDPEISRRCSVCGASFRQGAAFCPQCGQPIHTQPESEVADTQLLSEPPTEKSKSLSDFESAPTVALNKKDIESAPTVALNRSEIEAARRGQADQKPNVKVSRVGTHAENVREQVEKLRKVSHVVLDQAAYDPSVRFLLVATAFLVLFVILLIANRVLG